MYPTASISNIPNTQAMLNSSSAESGFATLFHCRPSNLCSSLDITSTPSPKHVLESTQDATFPILTKKNPIIKLNNSKTLTRRCCHILIDKPSHKSNDKANASRVKPNTVRTMQNILLLTVQQQTTLSRIITVQSHCITYEVL